MLTPGPCYEQVFWPVLVVFRYMQQLLACGSLLIVAFQAYYETDVLKSSSSFEISTVGSLQSFLMVFLGFLTGPLYDSGYSQHLLASGSFLIVAGMVAQSFCTELWQLLISQGLCIGLGCGCLAVLGVAIPSQWFTQCLPFANGIAASGSGVGG